MSQITQIPSEGGGGKQKPVAVPSRDVVTNLQLNTLLNVAGVMLNALLTPHRETDYKDPQLDGGAHAAATTTFINVCSRIDQLISEAPRWTLEAQNLLEAQMFQAYKQQTILLKAQTDEIRELNTPHFKYRPEFIKLRDGNYAVILGDVNDLDNAIVGVGDSPQKALEAFDGIFTGNLPQHLKDFLAAREHAILTDTQSPPYPVALKTEKENNESKPMVRKGNRRSNRTAAKRANSKRNRKGAK